MEDGVTTTAPAPVAATKPAPTPKPKAAKSAGKPAPKTTKPAANGKAAKPDRTTADVPARERRLALVKLMRKLGATGAASGRTVSELAAKLRYNDYDVYCLLYHKYPLAVGGYVKSAMAEDGVTHYLTAKGLKASDDDVRVAK